MSVVYANDVKDSRMNAVVAEVDAGAGAGKLEIGTAGMAEVLVSITLNDPCGSVLSQVLTFNGFPKTQAASATGVAAAARIRDSDNNDVITGLTVGTSATDIILDNTSINLGQDVTISSATITHG